MSEDQKAYDGPGEWISDSAARRIEYLQREADEARAREYCGSIFAMVYLTIAAGVAYHCTLFAVPWWAQAPISCLVTGIHTRIFFYRQKGPGSFVDRFKAAGAVWMASAFAFNYFVFN